MKTEIRPGIYWVGAIDWDLRDFHGYTTPEEQEARCKDTGRAIAKK